MTVTQPEEQQAYSLVRGTTNRVVGLYGQAKDYFPLLKNGLENVESRIPAEWVDRFTAASEPVIEKLDNQLDRVIAPVQDRVIAPVQHRVVAVKDLQQSVSLSDIKGAVTFVPTALITATGERVDQLKVFRGDLSKKAVVRLEESITAVREFSANRGKEMLHFDLVAYSEEVLDNASAAAKPLYEPVQKNLAAAIVKLTAAVAQLQDTAITKSNELKEFSVARRAEVNARLQAAMAAARELSATSVTFVQQKYSHVSEQLPNEQRLQDLATQLPYPVKDAVQFILQSPQLFLEVKTRADLTSSKRAIENVNSLLAAVKEVFVAPQAPSSEE